MPANLFKRCWSALRIIQISFDLWYSERVVAMLDNPAAALNSDVLNQCRIQKDLRASLTRHKKIFAERRSVPRGR